MFDIYFEEAYGKLYENLPNETLEVFDYKSELGHIRHKFIKRKIEQNVVPGDYYDIITPYGYGGPIIESFTDDNKKDDLVQGFASEFMQYVVAENIVSEFIRFHPVLENVKDFDTIYNTEFNSHTVGTNLSYDDPFMDEFSKQARKDIRKLLSNEDISYEVVEHPTDLNDFMEIYYSTMDRNDAADRYYFSEEYFQQIVDTLSEYVVTISVYLEDKLIAMGLYFAYGDYLHAHLSGTLSEYLSYSPAYLLRYALMEYGKANDYKFIHHGGGTTSDPKDGLLRFKQNFGKNTLFDFHLGKKIWDEEIYNALCEAWGKDKDTSFFPAYRAN